MYDVWGPSFTSCFLFPVMADAKPGQSRPPVLDLAQHDVKEWPQTAYMSQDKPHSELWHKHRLDSEWTFGQCDITSICTLKQPMSQGVTPQNKQ